VTHKRSKIHQQRFHTPTHALVVVCSACHLNNSLHIPNLCRSCTLYIIYIRLWELVWAYMGMHKVRIILHENIPTNYKVLTGAHTLIIL